jgi:dienelactone hydrolase
VKVVYNAERLVSGLFFAPSKPKESSVGPPYSDPRRFREEEVVVGLESWPLPATLAIPRGEGPAPGVVLVHGSGPLDRDETVGPNKPFRDLAWGLASRGVAVLRYEKRTLAHRTRLAEIGDSFTVKEETVDDVIEAVKLLRTRQEIDRERIFVAGHSLGGMLVPRIGMRDGGITGFVILAGAARPLEEMVAEQVRYIASFDGQLSDAEKERIRSIEEAVGKIRSLEPAAASTGSSSLLGAPPAYWLDLRGYQPHELARSLERPLLILQGGRDYQVTRVDFDLWRTALGGRTDVSFHLYPALNHLFITGEGPGHPSDYEKAGNVSGEVIEQISGWILAQSPVDRSSSSGSQRFSPARRAPAIAASR